MNEERNELSHSARLAEWSERYEALRDEYNALNAIFQLSPECKMSTAMHSMFESYTEAVALIVGDAHGWLEWYAWENDNGAACMEAKSSNWSEMKRICSTDDLLSLIANAKALPQEGRK